MCAKSSSNDWITLSWGVKSTISNFYSCHLFQGNTTKAMAIARSNSIDKEFYTWNNPDFRSGGTLTNNSNIILSILKDTAPCNVNASNNYMFSIGSYTSNILSYAPKNSCSSGVSSVSIISKGAYSQGCIGNDQITTYIAYPCGSYGNIGASLELYLK